MCSYILTHASNYTDPRRFISLRMRHEFVFSFTLQWYLDSPRACLRRDVCAQVLAGSSVRGGREVNRSATTTASTFYYGTFWIFFFFFFSTSLSFLGNSGILNWVIRHSSPKGSATQEFVSVSYGSWPQRGGGECFPCFCFTVTQLMTRSHSLNVGTESEKI